MRIGIDARKLEDFGIGTYLRELLAALARRPDDLRFELFISPGAKPPALDARFSCTTVSARGYSLREHIELARAARRARLTLYHAPHYVLPWLLSVPAVVTVHDTIHLRFPPPQPGGRLVARTLLRRAVTRARRVLTVSETSRRDLIELLGAAPERVIVIPNAVSARFHAPADPRADLELRRRLDLPDAPCVLWVGNLKPHKNVDRLLAAFARWQRDRTDAVLVMAGLERNAPALERTLRLAAQLGIGDSVVPLGHIADADMPGLYRNAHLLALPSLSEGFGLPLLEAMACGTPVLASNTSALPEVAGNAALLVDPTSVEALADGLQRLAGDTQLRDRLVLAGRERARQFSWDRTARLVVEAYQAALG